MRKNEFIPQTIDRNLYPVTFAYNVHVKILEKTKKKADMIGQMDCNWYRDFFYYIIPLGNSPGIMVNKLDKQTVVNEFVSHIVPQQNVKKTCYTVQFVHNHTEMLMKVICMGEWVQ